MFRLAVPIAAVLALLPLSGECGTAVAARVAAPFSERVERLLAQHIAGNGAPGAAAFEVGVRSMRTLPTAASDLSLQGEATLAGVGLNVPVHFEVILDRVSGDPLWVDLRWSEAGDATHSSQTPSGAAAHGTATLASRVSVAISARLAEEFDAQHSAFQLDAMEVRDPAEGAGHVLAIGQGTTVFVGEARVPTRFSAVFDRAGGELLALRYALQAVADPDAGNPLEIAVAPTP